MSIDKTVAFRPHPHYGLVPVEMAGFTPIVELDEIRHYAHQLATEELRCPRVRSDQREEAIKALARWLFDHRHVWAPGFLERPLRLRMPDDPGSPWPIIDRFFDEFRFDQDGHAVSRESWIGRVDR